MIYTILSTDIINWMYIINIVLACLGSGWIIP